jgi:outer membrane immunogenic protein
VVEPLLPGGPVANFSTDDTKVHVLRVGLNYKFGGAPGAGFPAAVAAAAMPVKARTPSVVAGSYRWTGFYLGGHRGYGWSNATGTGTEVPASFDRVTFNLDGDGVVGGAQLGFNWQVAPNWVIGVEADVSGTGIRGSSFAGVAFGGLPTNCCDLYMSKEIDWLATVRGRLGYAWDRWMVYGTGGVAWAGVSGDVFTNRPFTAEVRGSYRSTKTGWTGGGGIEWAFADNWTARAEYLYYDIDGFTVTATDTVGAGIVNNFTTDDTKVHVLRVGVNYKFGGLGTAPLVARH